MSVREGGVPGHVPEVMIGLARVGNVTSDAAIGESDRMTLKFARP
jgi:hypothetical protein